MRRLVAIGALVALLLSAMAVTGDNTPGTGVNIIGPEKVETGGEAVFNVKIYGPENIRWGFSVNLTGKNRAGGSLASPAGRTAEGNAFFLTHESPLTDKELNVTLTAPSKAGALTLAVDIYAVDGTDAAGQTASNRWVIDVKTKREVALNATVSNGGSVSVDNVKVAFQYKLGGEWVYISNESIPSIAAGAKENVTTTWNASLLGNGEYKVRIIVDPDREKVQFSGATNVIEKTVVLKEIGVKEAWTPSPALVGLVITLIIVGIGMIYWYQKKKIV